MRISVPGLCKTGAGKVTLRKRCELRAIIVIAALCGSLSLGVARGLAAQGITTAAIRGTVRTDDGTSVEGARVRVLNTATGVTVNTQVRYGRFFVQGIEVGGPYVVDVRHIGLLPQRSRPLFLTLGEPLDIEFVMQPVVIGLDTVRVSSAPALSGSATLIADSLVHRLPTLNRNFYDFVVLAPQISTKVGSQRSGVSASGANLRFNNFLINGADERVVNGNISPAAQGKSVPIDAVKEYQVLVAPYDVRYGDFAGALVNTVTQSGTNELRGSTFAYWRNDRLARGGELAPSQPYERLQYGFSLGGPIVRDRIHFFVAPELQHLSSPAPGPYAGQPAGSVPAVPVQETDVSRLEQIMRGYGLTAGSAGAVEIRSPLRNVFARLDAAIPRWSSRAIGFVNYSRAENDQFTRSVPDPTFHLSTYKVTVATRFRLTSVMLHTDLPRTAGGHNELQLSHISDIVDGLPDVRQPLVRILVPGTAGNLITLNAGTAEGAQGRFVRSRSMSIKNDLSLPWGLAHVAVVGIQAESFRIQRSGVNGAYGIWTFSGLDALERGVADRYELRKDFVSAGALLTGGQYAAYVGDSWRPGERVSITVGIRGDVIDFWSRAPYNAQVDSIFGRRTDQMPRARVHLSPRAGFTWDLPGAERDQLRGGVGIFTGRPPRAWFGPAVTSYGVGIGVLRCGNRPTDAGAPPPFEPDYRAAPTACATGPALEAAPFGEVDLLDRNLRMAQSLRASLAWDRHLPWGMVATTEALFSRYLSDFVFVNLNLEGPQAIDRFGRVLYGTVSVGGVSTPVPRSAFAEVIDLRNTSRNYSYQLSTRVERRFARGIAAVAGYTYSRTRDVQSPSRVNMPGIVMWADARAVSGRHDELTRGVSLNDLPHRTVAALTYTAPWQRWSTGLSFYYVGESGGPFTYLAGGVDRRGDLNADGSNANDPIYAPRDAADANEILFSGRSDSAGADNSPAVMTERVFAQQTAFERFVERTPCLRRQRGRIVERNSCREPWSHTTIASVRQAIPLGGRAVEAELDVFNVLNLLNRRWGRYRIAAPRLLDHVGHTSAPPESAQPIFRFDATRPQWTTLRTESAFQLQAALRYRF